MLIFCDFIHLKYSEIKNITVMNAFTNTEVDILAKRNSAAFLTMILKVSDIVFSKHFTFNWLSKYLSTEKFSACMQRVTSHNK